MLWSSGTHQFLLHPSVQQELVISYERRVDAYIIVSSERSLDFYRLLGFTETFRKKRKYDTAVLMYGYGMQLEIFIDPSHAPHPEQEPIGLRHFALRVEKLEDEIDRLRRESTEVIEVGPVMNDWTGVRFCFVKDYDGLSIELHE
jgi:glyoxylase I family protein